MEEQIENTNKSIESTFKHGYAIWIFGRASLAVFALLAVIGLADFSVNFNKAIVTADSVSIIMVFIGGFLGVRGVTVCVDILRRLFGSAGKYDMVSNELYSDRLVIKSFKKSGVYGEEIYYCRDFTRNKEYKKCFKLLASGKAGTVILKRGLSDGQLNAVRKLFGLQTFGDADYVLPQYAVRQNDVPALEEVVPFASERVIRTSFNKYYSRDKQMYLGYNIACALFVLLCLFGMLCYGAWCRMYEVPPTWAKAVMWVSTLALMADIVCFVELHTILKQSDSVEKAGAVSEYLFFADRMIVYTHMRDSFTFLNIPYDKIARVRLTKTDVWIDYPKGEITYPVIKSSLTTEEYNTLLKLLSRPYTGNTLELDSAPNIDPFGTTKTDK